MNQEIQDMSIEEIEFVNGGSVEGEQAKTLAVEFPEVVNNPPG